MKGICFEEGAFPNNCIGCRICELVCSFVHEQVINSEKSRIRVHKNERYGFNYPVTCIQCADPECAKVCPVGAIVREDGVVTIYEAECIGCGNCVSACPIDAIRLHPETGKAFKCDLCGGEPECVKWCPRGVLSLREHDTTTTSIDIENELNEYLKRVGVRKEQDDL